MLGLRTLGRAVRQLAGSLTSLSATLDEANHGLRQRLALSDDSHAPDAAAALPGPTNAVPAEPVQPSRRNGRKQTV